VGYRIIDERSPDESEHYESAKLDPFRKRAYDESRGYDGEHHLKNGKKLVRDSLVWQGSHTYASKADIFQLANDSA
jgi:hypothetical protein